MNDENKMPVPDEAQAFPAHAEDDIATLEREARAKREAELLNAQDDEEKDPVQPAVNKLKKRKRGKATAFLAIVAVTLIFLAWGGNWVYRNILWQPTEEKKQDTAPQTNKTDYRQRNDLGMSTDTAEEEPEQQDNGQSSTGGTGQVAPAAPPELNKASFLIRRDGSATTQNPVKTRQQEMTRRDAVEHLAVIRHQRFNPAPVQNTQFFDLPPGITDFQHHRIAMTQFGVQPQFKKLDAVLLGVGTTTEAGNIPPARFPAYPMRIRLHKTQPHFGDILGYQRNTCKHRMKGEDGFRIGFHALLPIPDRAGAGTVIILNINGRMACGTMHPCRQRHTGNLCSEQVTLQTDEAIAAAAFRRGSTGNTTVVIVPEMTALNAETDAVIFTAYTALMAAGA